MKKTYELTVMALLVAIGTLASQFVWFPAGIAKAYPVQHMINVIAAVSLGPLPAMGIAFGIGFLRNLFGTGSLLAFPGGMIGALLAGYLYQRIRKPWAAAVGEVMGTGIVASLVSVPYAALFMGKAVGALAFVPSFFISSLSGAAIGVILVSSLRRTILNKNNS